jgi:hypothetical protein
LNKPILFLGILWMIPPAMEHREPTHRFFF